MVSLITQTVNDMLVINQISPNDSVTENVSTARPQITADVNTFNQIMYLN